MSIAIVDRKKALEKAKLSQMTRQLMMRLQYARLKVDHGWQKQNLNEVENLYFHHYRTSKGTRSTSPLPPPASTSYLDEELITQPMSPILKPQPSIVFENRSNLPDPQTQPLSRISDSVVEDGAPIVRTPSPSTHSNRDAVDTSNDMDVDIRRVGATFIPAVPFPEQHRPPPTTLSANPHPDGSHPSPPQSPMRALQPGAGAVPSLPRTPLRSTSTAPPSLGKPFSPVSKPMATTSTNVSPGGGQGGPASMTYDTFWSSLSAGNQPTYKNALASAAQITGLNIGVSKGARP